MLKEIKLVLADIDGTLLNSKLELTPATRHAIKALKEADIQFGIATGRSPYSIKKRLNEWHIKDLTDWIIGFNGGEMYNCQTNQTLRQHQLEGRLIPDILHDFQGFHFNSGFQYGDSFYALKDDALGRQIASVDLMPLIVDDLTQFYNKMIPKFLIISDEKEMDRIIDHYQNNIKNSAYKPLRSATILLECVHPQLSKSQGISFLTEYLNLKPSQVMTFGDMMNDYEMIRDYVGVAMGNGDPRIKKVATYETLSNDEDGMAYFINHTLLAKD